MVMIPMDFCASAVPWEKDMKHAERTCMPAENPYSLRMATFF